MRPGHLPIFSTLWLHLLLPCMAHADGHGIQQAESYPSQQLLEFLADFGAIDDETFELIEYHAQQDSEPTAQEKSNEK